jgi:hypothetical protein
MPSSLFLYQPISCFPLWKEPVWKTCKNSNTVFQHCRSRHQGGRVIFRKYLNSCWLHLNRYSWHQYPISSPYCWWHTGQLFEWNASLYFKLHRFQLCCMEIILRYFQHELLHIFEWSFQRIQQQQLWLLFIVDNDVFVWSGCYRHFLISYALCLHSFLAVNGLQLFVYLLY